MTAGQAKQISGLEKIEPIEPIAEVDEENENSRSYTQESPTTLLKKSKTQIIEEN